MNAALVSPSLATILVYVASFVVVIWAVTDVVRRPTTQLSPGKKAAWIVSGWLFLGVVGAAIAVVYLVGPRKRMNAQR
jgi:drug/metabolite transporter (DMT)-like permease